MSTRKRPRRKHVSDKLYGAIVASPVPAPKSVSYFGYGKLGEMKDKDGEKYVITEISQLEGCQGWNRIVVTAERYTPSHGH